MAKAGVNRLFFNLTKIESKCSFQKEHECVQELQPSSDDNASRLKACLALSTLN